MSPGPAPFRDPHGVRTHVLWTESSLQASIQASCLVSAFASVVVASETGDLGLIDLRHGTMLSRLSLEDPVQGLVVTDHRVVVTTAASVLIYNLMDPRAADVNKSTTTGFTLLWERPVPEYFDRFVGPPLVLSGHVIQAMEREGAVGLASFDLKSQDNDWEGDSEKALAGRFGFLTAGAADRILLGSDRGVVRGFVVTSGLTWFESQIPMGLAAPGILPAPVCCEKLHAVAEGGTLYLLDTASSPVPRPLGQAHVELPGFLGVSEHEVVLGTQRGELVRYNAAGLDRREFKSLMGEAGTRAGFTTPPILFDGGRLIAADAAGAAHFFGPLSDGGSPAIKHFSFTRTGRLTGLIGIGPTLIGTTSTGEVQALKIVEEEP